jgi:3-oxoacyl-[acyl-carrier protein] reductase
MRTLAPLFTCIYADHVAHNNRNGYLGGRTKDDDDVPVIINVSSLLGLQGGYGVVAYAASKAGVLGFTRALATEYASHKVRINAIVPGYVETDMTKGV